MTSFATDKSKFPTFKEFSDFCFIYFLLYLCDSHSKGQVE